MHHFSLPFPLSFHFGFVSLSISLRIVGREFGFGGGGEGEISLDVKIETRTTMRFSRTPIRINNSFTEFSQFGKSEQTVLLGGFTRLYHPPVE